MTATANSPVIGRGWFIAIMAVTLVLGWLFLRRAYDNPVATVLVLWALSFGMANVWAKLYYHRWVFSPSDQYPSFWRGDLLWLPLLMAVPLCLLLRHVPDRDRPYWFESWWWPVIAAGIGIAFAGWFWWTQRAVFPCGALYSGPKLWHDLVE
ncbi:MAG TPA: hypothetical protein VLF67_00940, partial [Candidatus Saccharimonas sp.]|nr:hypothetical protein [Candidatus Saccharimonas sp.]